MRVLIAIGTVALALSFTGTAEAGKDATDFKFELPHVPLKLGGDHLTDATEVKLGSNGGRAQEKAKARAEPKKKPAKSATGKSATAKSAAKKPASK